MEIIRTEHIHPLVIYSQKLNRFLRIGILLHLTAFIGVLLFLRSGSLALEAAREKEMISFLGYGWLAAYGFILPFFAELDAFSRYQNYKKAKDLFHENGFKKRIANLFIVSRCQRDAVKVAARDLGILDELTRHYHGLGYRWYHILPDVIFSNPKLLFSLRFWKRTFFESPYTSKYFLW